MLDGITTSGWAWGPDSIVAGSHGTFVEIFSATDKGLFIMSYRSPRGLLINIAAFSGNAAYGRPIDLGMSLRMGFNGLNLHLMLVHLISCSGSTYFSIVLV